jgi:RNA polymerase sigma factor (sigma-70 family)
VGDAAANLLVQMRSGDEAAARRLWSSLSPRLIAYAAAVLPPRLRAGAADAVQAVFCSVLRMPAAEVARIGSGEGFLLTSVRNQCISAIRAHRREVVRLQTAAHLRPRPEATIGALADAELVAALESLPRRQREVVILRHVLGLSFDQIEASTGINRNTASSVYRVAVATLERLLGPEADGPALERGVTASNTHVLPSGAAHE